MNIKFKFDGVDSGNLKSEMERAIKDELRKNGISDLSPRVNVEDGTYDFPGASAADIERVKKAFGGTPQNQKGIPGATGISGVLGVSADGQIVTPRRKRKSK